MSHPGSTAKRRAIMTAMAVPHPKGPGEPDPDRAVSVRAGYRSDLLDPLAGPRPAAVGSVVDEPPAGPTPSPAGVTVIEREESTDDATEDGPVAHIVRTAPGEDAAAKILEARINGTPLEALCGHVWVPSRDPARLPVCQKCLEIYRMYREFNDGLDETPRT